MKKNDTKHKQFEQLSIKFYKAEVKRNKLKVKDKELKNKIELRTPKVSKEKQDKLKDKIKRLQEKIQKLEDKKVKNIKQLDKKANAIKDNPSIKEDIIRKGSAYKTEITFLRKNLNDFEKKLKLYKEKASDKDGLMKYQNKRIEHKVKLKVAEKSTKELQKNYIEFQDKIRTEHQHTRRKDVALSIQNLDAYYGSKKSLHDISLDFPRNKVISLIGASGSGKSTLLRTFNRINDEVPSFRAKGKILYHDYMDVLKLRSIYDSQERITIPELRTNIGMVFQQPNPFPMSVYKNVIYGPKINGVKGEAILRSIAEKSLKRSALWDEVKDNLSQLGTSLSGGQQQRLCIARAIANSPDILLMDEPTSALDPLAAAKIEELILELKEKYTIIIVTHSMQQAKRISDYTAFLHEGRLVEYGLTKKIFSKPIRTRTKDYISGKFG